MSDHDLVERFRSSLYEPEESELCCDACEKSIKIGDFYRKIAGDIIHFDCLDWWLSLHTEVDEHC